MAEREVFLGVPQGSVRVENPDGVFLGSPTNHNLYNRQPPIPGPTIPGDYDFERTVRRD
jgi:hypothetical protein